MLAKPVIACLAAAAFVAANALMPTGASARAPGAPGAANVPQPGTWNWPPYAEGGVYASSYLRLCVDESLSQ
jgi:hypothetical protein